MTFMDECSSKKEAKYTSLGLVFNDEQGSTKEKGPNLKKMNDNCKLL